MLINYRYIVEMAVSTSQPDIRLIHFDVSRTVQSCCLVETWFVELLSCCVKHRPSDYNTGSNKLPNCSRG